MVKTFRALENSRYKALQQFAIPPTPKLSPAGKDRWDNPFSFDGFSSSEDEGGATPKGAGREDAVAPKVLAVLDEEKELKVEDEEVDEEKDERSWVSERHPNDSPFFEG